MATEKQSDIRHPSEDKPWLFKPGQSGNPKGRPPGKTLKEYTRDMLAAMNEQERNAFLTGIPKEIIWKMAEGSPKTDVDLQAKITISDILNEIEDE